MLFRDIDMFTSFLYDKKEIVCYGAGMYSDILYHYLSFIGRQACVNSYIVSDDIPAEREKYGKPILSVREYSSLGKHVPVLITAREQLHVGIIEQLQKYGIKDYYCVTDNLMQRLRQGDIEKLTTKESAAAVDRILASMRCSEKETATDVLFITPPYWDMYSPFSAVPSLIGKMETEGIRCQQIDLGILCFHRLLRRVWKYQAQFYLSDNFYQEKVCKYKANLYSSYEEYRRALWYFQGEKFPMQRVKDEYGKMNAIQRGVLGLFYDAVYAADVTKINFNVCEDIPRIVTMTNWANLYGTLLEPEMAAKLKNLPAIIGISVTSIGQFLPACRMAELIKAAKPATKIIFGGSCADLFVNSLYREKKDIYRYFDYIVAGEGETALLQLYAYLQGDSDVNLYDIPNLAFIDQENRLTFTESLLEDVEDLPLPSYEGIDFDLYLAPKPILPYQASRGCHYGHCAFCNHNEKYRHHYRPKSTGKIIQELLTLAERYHIQHFQFVDEAIRPDQFQALVEAMDHCPAFRNMHWFFYSRVSRQYDDAILDIAKRNGCEMVMFGVETFNQRLLNFIKKGIQAAVSKYCLELFHRHGIRTYAWLMYNLPSETVDEVRADVQVLRDNIGNVDAFAAGPFLLEINTDMYKNQEQYNILKDNLASPSEFVSHYQNQVVNKGQMLACGLLYRHLMLQQYFSINRYSLFFGEGGGLE